MNAGGPIRRQPASASESAATDSRQEDSGTCRLAAFQRSMRVSGIFERKGLVNLDFDGIIADDVEQCVGGGHQVFARRRIRH